MLDQIVPQVAAPPCHHGNYIEDCDACAEEQALWSQEPRTLGAYHMPGALLDCEADALRALRPDVAAIEYTCIRTARMNRGLPSTVAAVDARWGVVLL